MTVGVPVADIRGHGVRPEVPAEREATAQDVLRHAAGVARGERAVGPVTRDAHAATSVYDPESKGTRPS